MRLLKFALAGVCALGLFGPHASAKAEPVKIRMSWVAPLANWASILLEKKDLMKHLGKSDTLETIFRGTPPRIQRSPITSRSRQPRLFSFPIAVANAGLSDLVVIADEFQEGRARLLHG